jgi:ferredoxin
MCAAIAGPYFRLGDDEQSRPIATEIAPDDSVRDAMASCPMEAILVTEASTGELIDP